MRSRRPLVLLAGLLLCALAASAQVAAPAPPALDLAKWEAEIRAFEEADRQSPPPTGGIVFAGSSSIRLWTTMTDDFAGLPVLNRGFGGSQIREVTAFADRIVIPYRPRLIVFYCGSNDVDGGQDGAGGGGRLQGVRREGPARPAADSHYLHFDRAQPCPVGTQERLARSERADEGLRGDGPAPHLRGHLAGECWAPRDSRARSCSSRTSCT